MTRTTHDDAVEELGDVDNVEDDDDDDAVDDDEDDAVRRMRTMRRRMTWRTWDAIRDLCRQ